MNKYSELDLIKLLLVATLAYQENYECVLKGEELNILNYSTVQYLRNGIALSKLQKSDIDVNEIKSIDELLKIVN